MYKTEYTPRAVEDLNLFKTHEQQQSVYGIDVQLRYEPTGKNPNSAQIYARVLKPFNCIAPRIKI